MVILFACNSGLMQQVPMDRCTEFEEQLIRHVSASNPEILKAISESKDLTDDVEASLTASINNFLPTFT